MFVARSSLISLKALQSYILYEIKKYGRLMYSRPSINHFYKSSTNCSDLNLKKENPSSGLSSNPQTHPTAIYSNSKRSPTRLPLSQRHKLKPSDYRAPESLRSRLSATVATLISPSWYGAWWFACEYVRSMQALVTKRMEHIFATSSTLPFNFGRYCRWVPSSISVKFHYRDTILLHMMTTYLVSYLSEPLKPYSPYDIKE